MFNEAKRSNTLMVIAGPCSAESRGQLSETVDQLMRDATAQLIRVGAWKPRTQPGHFEGAGEQALQWIAELKRRYPSARFAVEVATPAHVERAMRHGIDAVWLGARTVGNPFDVREVCQALKGCPVSVLVKNPQAPDVKLWQGAIERVAEAGIDDVAAVHRGFVTPSNTPMRNTPLWKIPIELRRLNPDLPLLCDPSHLGGDSTWVHSLSQTALNMGFDGLMIEVHCCPSEALTDAKQQITPKQLKQMLSALERRNSCSPQSAALESLREQLNWVDHQLMGTLAERLDIARRIADVKQATHSTAYQPKQWNTKLQQCLAEGAAMGLDAKFVSELYELIHLESIRVQEERLQQQPPHDTI